MLRAYQLSCNRCIHMPICQCRPQCGSPPQAIYHWGILTEQATSWSPKQVVQKVKIHAAVDSRRDLKGSMACLRLCSIDSHKTDMMTSLKRQQISSTHVHHGLPAVLLRRSLLAGTAGTLGGEQRLLQESMTALQGCSCQGWL